MARTAARGVIPLDYRAVDGRSLRPGANDIRYLSTGVYFLEQASGSGLAPRKLVVER